MGPRLTMESPPQQINSSRRLHQMILLGVTTLSVRNPPLRTRGGGRARGSFSSLGLTQAARALQAPASYHPVPSDRTPGSRSMGRRPAVPALPLRGHVLLDWPLLPRPTDPRDPLQMNGLGSGVSRSFLFHSVTVNILGFSGLAMREEAGSDQHKCQPQIFTR